MAIPDFQTLMLPVLREASTGEVRISEVVERLANEFNLSPEQRSHLLTSGRQTTFANRVHWAKSYLGKAGLIELTDVKYLSQFEGFQAFREGGEPADAGTDAMPDQPVGITLTPDEVMRAASHQLEAALASELLQRVVAGTPAFFESL